MADNKMTNIAVYRKKTHINVGIIIFGAVFIYLFATVLMYLTNKHVSAYEVREGSIVKDNTYTGFVIREESTITADRDGYVNYFAPEESKVGARTSVYTSSAKKLNLNNSTSTETNELSSEEERGDACKDSEFQREFQRRFFSGCIFRKGFCKIRTGQQIQSESSGTVVGYSDFQYRNRECI